MARSRFGCSDSFIKETQKKLKYPLAPTPQNMIYYSHFSEHGVVAQLVSALDCRSGGCGFEPRRPRQYGKVSEIASWCNGSTADSDSACWGSSPCEATITKESLLPQAFFLHFLRAG